MQKATSKPGGLVFAFLFGSDMCFLKWIFWLPPSSVLWFPSRGSWGVKNQLLLSQQWMTKALQEAPKALQLPLELAWCVTLVTPTRWIVDPQDQLPLSVDLLLLHHAACNVDTACVLIAFSPVNSNGCDWKKKRFRVTGRGIILQKNWRHRFWQM